MIVAENASKLFLDGAVVAFRQLNLSVAKNEIMCVVGPSGCGKTTLLRCIAGLTDISTGRLTVEGKPVDGPPDSVAMVFQHFGLLPWKTVYENAAFGLAMAGAPTAQIKERVAHYHRRGRPQRLREALSLPALRRHAAARRPGPRAGDEPAGAADGRAVRRARRADPRNPAGRIARADGAPGRAQDHGVHHPLDRRGDPARRSHRGDERAARPHQGNPRHAVRPAAQCRRHAHGPAVRRIAPAHLASAPHRAAEARAGAAGGRREHRRTGARSARPKRRSSASSTTTARAPNAPAPSAGAASRCTTSSSAWCRWRSSWRSGRSPA